MLLQYVVKFHLFSDPGRLNPEVPLEKAGDCGANALYLLGLITEQEAMELSRQQNKFWKNKNGDAITLSYLLDTYLFTDPTKHYENRECTQEQLMHEVQALKPGYGTFLFMRSVGSKLGHFICIYKNVDTEQIELADLQTEEIIHNYHEPHRLEEYLSKYELFYIPFELDAASPTKRHPRAEESIGSPSKSIPRHSAESPRRAERYESPARQYAAERYASPARQYAAESYESPRHTERYASPLTPQPKKKKVGGTRKRKTRRKN